MKRKKLLAGMLAAVSVTMTSAIAACTTEPADEPQTEGPETGVYYFDAGTDEYTLVLGNVDEFTFLVNGVTKKGTYTLSGGTLYLDFAQAEDENITATLEDDVITLTYQDASMRFLKRIDYTVTYDTQGRGSVEADTVINGKTVSAPEVPAYDGYTFVGWYTDTTYMTPFLFDAQPVTGDMTLYAYWLATSEEKAEYTVDFDLGYDAELPAVETVEGCVIASELPTPVREGYTSSGVSWEAVSGAKVYDVTITAPNGLTQAFRNLQTTSQSYDFSAEDAGEYVVTVTASAANSAEGDPNAVTATRYFNNKALAAVSSFTVVSNSALLFKGVENAQRYYLTIECGNPAHRHEDVELGSSTNYNFSNCAMQEGGIRFTVRAEADGYAPSVSKMFVYNRALAQVTGLTYDAATETIRWDAVADAMSYVIAVGNTVKDIGSATSYCIKDCAAGEVTFTVYPRTKGYNSPVPSELKVTKATLATPQDITVRGNTLTWNAVEGATSYTVRINGTEYASDTNSFDLSQYESAGELSVMVRADGLLLEQYAFQGSVSLEEITLPARMTSVELASALFDGCDALENIYVEAGSANYVSVDGLLCDETGATLLYYPSGRTGAFTVPVTITAIGDGAFAGHKGLTQVTIGAYVQSVGEGAFEGCVGLTSVEFASAAIPQEMTIGEGAFRDCAYLERVTFGENSNVTSIGGYAFSGCRRLEAFTIPETVTEIGTYAFENCATLEEITLTGQSVTVGNYAFSGCESLDSVSIGASVESFNFILVFNDCAAITTVNVDPNNAFFATYDDVLYNKDLTTLIFCPRGRTEVSIADSTLVIGDNAFESCQITDVTLPDGVTTIGAKAFRESALTQITLPESLLSICDEAFCSSKVTALAIPESATQIGKSAFSSCRSLKSVTLPSTLTSIGERMFYSCSALESIKIPETVTSIGAYAFTSCSALPEIVLPAGVTEIGANAFQSCSSIESMVISSGVTGINNYLFQSCSSLTSVTLPAGIKSIGMMAFYSCRALSEITLPSGLESIGSTSFANCAALTSVVIPETVTSIGSSAFYNCGSLTALDLPDGISSTASNAFQNCFSLQSITLPAALTAINSSLFSGCTALKSLVLPEGLLTIGSSAFSNCKSLTELQLPASVVTVSAGAFTGCAALSLTVDQANTHLTVQNGVLYENRSSALGDDAARQPLRRLHRIEGSRHQRSHYRHRQLRVPQYRDHIVHDRQQRDVRRILRLQRVRGAHLARL